MAQFVNGFMQDADMKNLARDASTSAPAEKKTVAGPVKNRDRPSGSTLASLRSDSIHLCSSRLD